MHMNFTGRALAAVVLMFVFLLPCTVCSLYVSASPAAPQALAGPPWGSPVLPAA